MKYLAAILIVLGLGIITGAATQEWLPMLITQVGLGTVTLIAGGLVAGHIKTEED